VTNRERIWIWGLAITLIASTLLLPAAAAQGQTPDVDIPIDTILRGEPGDTFLMATVTASPGLACDAFLDGRNNESVHPGTDILIQSGANFAMIGDVETAAFNTDSTTFTTGGLIEVFIRLGADGVSSTGFTLALDCQPHIDQPPPPIDGTTTTTTTAVTTTTTTPPPATTTTTEPPPINGPDTGGGACADGACNGFSLSPFATWLWLFAALFGVLGAGLAWAVVRNGDSE